LDKRREVNKMVFERLEKRQIFVGEIIAITPLHIGSGKQDIRIGEAISVLRNIKGIPYIPGSSIKGNIRGEAEKIARKLGHFVCNPPNTKEMCGTLKKEEKDICITCQIFGTAGENISRASKVKFRDALPIGDVTQFEIRTGTALDRETGSVYKKALYTVEAVPAGTKFNFEMVAENLTDQELGLLMAAIKSVQDSGLGGSSTRGFGKITIEIKKVHERSAEFYVGKTGEQVLEGEKLDALLKKKE
jgi:CRISPR-associated RAMP protein (TIGR02581 family)